MILADTSVWIAHFRTGCSDLRTALAGSQVLTHPFVIGELACGTISNRRRVLGDLAALPEATIAQHDEVLGLIDDRRLWSKGLGWIDAHLLASALLSDARLWTLDRRLNAIACDLHVSSDAGR